MDGRVRKRKKCGLMAVFELCYLLAFAIADAQEKLDWSRR